MGHAYSETPDEDAGWDREEVYKDTQQQRALEAEIRKNKRIAANESATDLEKAEAKAKIWNAQKKLRELTSSKPWLRRDASREKASELDVQPRGAKIAAKVSSGKSTFESFYEPEDLWLSVNGKEIWHGTGDVNGVTFPDESELKGYRYPEISGVHTHTTSVGGTFSSEDVKALTGLDMKGLEARETLNKQRVYSLSRIAPQSNNTRNQFYEKMHEYETARFQALSEKYYDKYCAPFGVPLTQQDYVKIDKQLKRDLHQWLKRNAIKYGYKYEQQK